MMMIVRTWRSGNVPKKNSMDSILCKKKLVAWVAEIGALVSNECTAAGICYLWALYMRYLGVGVNFEPFVLGNAIHRLRQRYLTSVDLESEAWCCLQTHGLSLTHTHTLSLFF